MPVRLPDETDAEYEVRAFAEKSLDLFVDERATTMTRNTEACSGGAGRLSYLGGCWRPAWYGGTPSPRGPRMGKGVLREACVVMLSLPPYELQLQVRCRGVLSPCHRYPSGDEKIEFGGTVSAYWGHPRRIIGQFNLDSRKP